MKNLWILCWFCLFIVAVTIETVDTQRFSGRRGRGRRGWVVGGPGRNRGGIFRDHVVSLALGGRHRRGRG